ANPRLIAVFTVFLLGASVLPVFALCVAVASGQTIAAWIAFSALLVAHVPRVAAAFRLKQSLFGAMCHVPATVTFVVLQWIALTNHLRGKRIAWRGRADS
ncbi:MAG: glycosyl transferase, partial [Planctomycetota bacterium]